VIVAFYSLWVSSPIHNTNEIIDYLSMKLIPTMINAIDSPVIFENKISLKYS